MYVVDVVIKGSNDNIIKLKNVVNYSPGKQNNLDYIEDKPKCTDISYATLTLKKMAENML